MSARLLGIVQNDRGASGPVKARFRRLWLNIHLAVGLGAAVLLVPISLSGALLVWHDHLDALINPPRYAVTAGPALPPSVLLARAREALAREAKASEFQPVVVRTPESAGWPVTISAREPRRGESGARPRVLTIYLDPPNGRVLDIVEFRTSLIGFLHRFHENLTIPEYSGRAIVGWSGVAMLVMSLTGIYLWWPRSAGFRRGLNWRRGPTLSSNLHHMLGFWIAIPLAAVSVTGIYLGFPQQGRDLLGSIAPMTPQQRGGFAAPLLRETVLDIDRVHDIALRVATDARLAAIFLPSQQTGAWRVHVREAHTQGLVTVLVDDRSAAVQRLEPRTGDRIAQWIRWIHEGSHAGPIWQTVVFLCGILPTVFVITGLMIWLRSRRAKAIKRAVSGAPQVDAAE